MPLSRLTPLCLLIAALAACAPGDDTTPSDVALDRADSDIHDVRDSEAIGCRTLDDCPDGQDCCDGTCRDLMNNDLHCGDCATVCNFDEFCDRGICSSAECFPECDARQTCCRGDCVDILSDDANCGGCDLTCDLPMNCVGGACMCGSGATAEMCTGSESCCPAGCADLLSDPANCGACGADCGGGPCTGGQCTCGTAVCAPGQACCEDECVDLQGDPNHCGTCDGRCDLTRSEGCVEGRCLCGIEEQCPSGTVTYPLCQISAFMPPYRCCSGRCEAINDDSCTACGRGCSGTDVCQASPGLFSCNFECGPEEE